MQPRQEGTLLQDGITGSPVKFCIGQNIPMKSNSQNRVKLDKQITGPMADTPSLDNNLVMQSTSLVTDANRNGQVIGGNILVGQSSQQMVEGKSNPKIVEKPGQEQSRGEPILQDHMVSFNKSSGSFGHQDDLIEHQQYKSHGYVTSLASAAEPADKRNNVKNLRINLHHLNEMEQQKLSTMQIDDHQLNGQHPQSVQDINKETGEIKVPPHIIGQQPKVRAKTQENNSRGYRIKRIKQAQVSRGLNKNMVGLQSTHHSSGYPGSQVISAVNT